MYIYKHLYKIKMWTYILHILSGIIYSNTTLGVPCHPSFIKAEIEVQSGEVSLHPQSPSTYESHVLTYGCNI